MKRLDLGDVFDKKILIYGAHLVALEYYRYLVDAGHGDSVVGFAVTESEGNPSVVEGLPVNPIQEYSQYVGEMAIVIAMPVKYHSVVRQHVGSFGFEVFDTVSLEEMSAAKGESLIASWGNPSFRLKESELDPTWLDAVTVDGRTTFKFPTLFYLDRKTITEFVRQNDPVVSYCHGLCHIKNLRDLPDYEKDGGAESNAPDTLQIYMAFGVPELEMVKNSSYAPWVKPLQVGSGRTDKRWGAYSDDGYDGSLSWQNPIFAEMTGAHWVWKRAPVSKYKGLCHYRRHFVLSEKTIRVMEDNEIDALLTIPRYVPGGVRNMFLAETPVKAPVMESMDAALKESASEDRRAFEEYLDGVFYCPNNMVVARQSLYDSYCAWIFPILLRMWENDRRNGYGHEEDRHIAYAAELLTSFYFMRKREGLRIAVTDYKFLM